jgi:predicted ArsR family transcriptional regulator
VVTEDFAEQVAGVGALAEPARRALYLHVAAAPEAVSREQAAAAVGVPLHSAKFHLDRLVDEGLLAVEFRRLSGRRGPGAGRPAKLYRRSARQLSVSLPQRRYDIVGDLLAEGVDRSLREGVPVAAAVREAATAAGRSVAAEEAGPGPADERLACVLARHGYEPRSAGGEITLANCPFDRLAGRHTALVCGLNLDFVRGMLQQLGLPDDSARLAPQAGACCVTVHRPEPTESTGSSESTEVPESAEWTPQEGIR